MLVMVVSSRCCQTNLVGDRDAVLRVVDYRPISNEVQTPVQGPMGTTK